MTVQHWVGLDENEAHEGSNMEVDSHSKVGGSQMVTLFDCPTYKI